MNKPEGGLRSSRPKDRMTHHFLKFIICSEKSKIMREHKQVTFRLPRSSDSRSLKDKRIFFNNF